MYVTLKLDGSGWGHCMTPGPAGPYRIHSRFIQDFYGNEEIVTNNKYVVMPWKMVTNYGTNMTLKEAVEEIEKCEEDRRLVSEFEAEHRDEIFEILGIIDYIDKGYVKERFPEIYNFGPSDWVYTSKINSFVKTIAPVTRLTKGIANSIISKRPLKHIRVEMQMQLNTLRVLGY